ncbi:MAG: ribonuclease D [Anaerolineae bacterium]|jgi:ribonuclease D|nr:ribonuclease D [Anaerolineae bacterium]MBT7072677.1 ribonuclease D [Anaerolineae bacterium]MBT7326858.1 ribonuclease D [Anaerolineae bacterium]
MTKKTLPPPTWVASKTALKNMLSALEEEASIAVDTESNSLHAYQEQVCLIQFSTSEKDYLLDPFALPDLSDLAPFFANPDIEKIFHAAEYDLICLQRDFGFQFANIFDTMIAARILGYQAVGLGKLLDSKFDVQVDKKYQKANWGKRPLTEEMLNYARLDTHYLIALRKILKKDLKDKNRWELAQEDFEMATYVNGMSERQQLPLWERVGGRAKLAPREATVLNEICLAREALAAKLNRPVFKVVSNKTLLKLAESMPRSRRDLEISGFTPRQISRFGKPFLAAVERGLHADFVRRTPSKRPSDEYISRLDILRNWRKEKAKTLGVESDIVLPRPLMENIARKNPRRVEELRKIMEKTLWRMQEYGDEILEKTQ